MTNWYDYDNQEMVSLPPVGEEVYVNTFNVDGEFIREDYKVIVIGYHKDKVVFFYNNDYYSEIADKFRPLDWNKNEGKTKLIDHVSDAIYTRDTGVSIYDVVVELYELGYLKFPEDK